MDNPKIDFKPFLVLSALVIIGAALRFYVLGFQAMNYDEIFTTKFANPALSVTQLVIQALSFDFTPPLYYLAAHFSMQVFGQNAIAIRIPSVICGVLLIPVMYFVGREYRDELFGYLLAFITTFLYTFFYYARYGRAYSMELLWFTIMFYFFMRLLKEHTTKDELLFTLFALLSLWTHLFSVIPVGIMVIWLLWTQKFYKGIVPLVLCSLPLLNYVNIIMTMRVIGVGNNDFGAKPLEILLGEPLDLFAYSALIIFPIALWVIATHWDDIVLRFTGIVFGITWAAMLVLSFRTPIILHYSLFCVPMLLLAFTFPFWEAIRERVVQFQHICIIVIVLLMELLQMTFIWTMQRVP